jgi:hypothetical protein
MKMPDPLRSERAHDRLVNLCFAGLIAAIVLVAALHAFGQDQPADDPPPQDTQIVDLNALPPLPELTEWQHPLPDDDDWNGPGMVVWQRADIEADRRAVDAMREQTRAIQAQTAALTRIADAQQQTAANIAALTEAVENIEFSGEFSGQIETIPPDVAEALVPALTAIKDWLDPPADDPAPDAGN